LSTLVLLPVGGQASLLDLDTQLVELIQATVVAMVAQRVLGALRAVEQVGILVTAVTAQVIPQRVALAQVVLAGLLVMRAQLILAVAVAVVWVY
jgi:hypothetical protein